ncbi:MAG: archaemetzincin family Zn-dependent metalloprotease [Thermoproteota archaeon]|nr:archaemetzincin family Zn-dependent metalloprotease [Thermoproteota archaeon]
MTTTIALVPIAVDEKDKKNIFDPLTSHLASIFDASITILTDLPQLDSFRVLFNEQRNQQLNSDKLLHRLAPSIVNHIKSYDPGTTIILAICDIDAYSPGLNFVFGQASSTGRVAVIYLPRLRQEFYGLSANTPIFIERVLKEATHEVGHAFGLGHCPKQSCVMHFSNSLVDTDRKAKDFCIVCSNKLHHK